MPETQYKMKNLTERSKSVARIMKSLNQKETMIEQQALLQHHVGHYDRKNMAFYA